jgi:hypothetical protein
VPMVCVCACARAPSLRLIDSALDRFCKELGVTDTKAYALTALPVRKLPWQRLIHSASFTAPRDREKPGMNVVRWAPRLEW